MLTMQLFTWFKGYYMGCDDCGNKYYQEKFLFSQPTRPPRRWVLYKNKADGSSVPSEWHGWLHFTHETPIKTQPYDWQKAHQPNLTGTTKAYRPPRSALRSSATANFKRYESWSPKD